MNRPKFRAWDKQEGKWYEPIHEAYRGELFEITLSLSGDILVREMIDGEVSLSHESVPQYKDRYIIMQSTGLLDKDGKEIWQGDILEITDTMHTYNMPVIFDEGCYRLDRGGEWGCLWEWNENSKVVGNIYQNPNLLQKTNEDN